MCSKGKRSFGGDSDDDFDDSLHKRLKIRRRETNVKTRGTSKAKQPRQRLQIRREVRIQKVNDVSTKSTSSCDSSVSLTATVTSAAMPSIAGNGSFMDEEDECFVVNDKSSDLNDSRLSADQLISDIFGDECDDGAVNVTDVHQTSTATTTSSTDSVQRLPEVPSHKKQLSLFQYFNLKGAGKSISVPHQSNSNGGTNKHSSVSMHQSNSSSKTLLTKQNSTELSNSIFSNKSRRDCPFYKKIPGTCNIFKTG